MFAYAYLHVVTETGLEGSYLTGLKEKRWTIVLLCTYVRPWENFLSEYQ